MKSLINFDASPKSIGPRNMIPTVAQDTVHIGTKMRNRLLNTSIVLTIGKRVATVAHIKTLIEILSKEKHGLVSVDISPEDRQNLVSLEKVMQSRVLEALKSHVADSEGTIKYTSIYAK